MSNIVPFMFKDKEVRAITGEDGSAWFIARDVCAALGFSNPSDAVKSHCKLSKKLSYSDSLGLTDQANGLIIIPEPDLYRLVVRANTPEAVAFEKWVMEDVLPTIRKTGVYVAPTPAGVNLKEVPVVAKAFRALASMAKVLGLSPNQAALSAAQSLRANYKVDVIELLALPGLESPTQERHLTPTEIGKQFGQSGRAINLALAEQGFQFKGEDGEWRPTDKGRPYAVYLDTTKKHHNGTPIQQLRWLESVTTLLDIEHRPPLELVAGK